MNEPYKGENVVKPAVLEGLAKGVRQSADNVLRNISEIYELSMTNQRKAVIELSEALVDGITSETYSVYHFEKLVFELVNLSQKLGLEVYESIFSLMYPYDNLSNKTSQDLANRRRFDGMSMIKAIEAGARAVDIINGSVTLEEQDEERLLKTAEKALLYALKHGGPETKIKAAEALANFGGSEVKIELNEMIKKENENILLKKTIEETIDVISVKEAYERAMNNRKIIVSRYPDESLPQRFVIDIVYESIETLLYRRNIGKNIECAVATRQLIHLLQSSSHWRNLFSSENKHDYEKFLELDVILTDIQTALLHVVKRGNNEALQREALEVLANKGGSNIMDIFKEIFERRERGYDLVLKHIIPKPRAESRSLPPPVPKVKKRTEAVR